MSDNGSRKALDARRLAFIPVSLFILILLILDAGGSEVMDVLSDMDLAWLPVLIGLYLLNVLTKAYRWHRLVRHCGSEVSFLTILPMFIVGLGINNLTPGRVAGDPARAFILKKAGHARLSSGIGTVFFEKVMDFLTLSIVSALGVALLFSEWWGVVGSVLLFSFLICGLLIAFMIVPVRDESRDSEERKQRSGILGLVQKVWNKSLGFIRRVKVTLTDLSSNPGVVLSTISLTATIWINEAIRLYIVLKMLDIDAGPGPILVAATIASLAGVVLPLGVGNAAAITAIFQLTGVSAEASVAASLVMVASSIWLSVALMAGALAKLGMHVLDTGNGKSDVAVEGDDTICPPEDGVEGESP